MPSVSEKQRKFMGAELKRKREGKRTRTGMSEKQLEDYASKPLMSKYFHKKSKAKGIMGMYRGVE